MDIKHLRYFIAIVENDFNLSRTARSLYISQPTLSVMINNFEEKEGIKLFQRQQNKLLGLTLAGKIFYQDAQELIKQYYRMQHNLHNHQTDIKGTVTIGLPPFLLSVVFSSILPKIMMQHPEIHFDIQEKNTELLKQDLLLETVDLAVLLHPEGLSRKLIDTYLIQTSELVLLMSPNHHLSQKKTINWPDLHNQNIAIFDESFMNHHLIKARFEQIQLDQTISLETSSWDFLVNAVRMNDNLIAFIPQPLVKQQYLDDLIIKRMNEPIPWRVTLCRLKKQHYTALEQFVLDLLLTIFIDPK
ncbi:LysR family transcriptional regulator [Vagococcus zengguangii]|uniref:LysR family transcriptional regulator n=1 Tax=Vagococcus zengguangii TaxID=2571750 RepID=A0A4D7CRD6_9ENTE|nr:LysR family transcriptional regulator [Vagococcus zengguangii]QCI85563.1 LysR family transcriptional regulator [Vagococcus zengguangii]TLG79416.1 LysR family transcriptional regulator [Vagococcus zengguangii]